MAITYLKKVLAKTYHPPIFALLKKENAALVKGLRRIPFTDESRVRFPYAVQGHANAWPSYFFLESD
jgi:hypothetical protein